MFFLLLWPLFARAPRHWFLENFLLSAPGVQSVCFFLLRSVGRRDLSAGPEQKKNTTQGVFFLLRPRGKAGEGEAPCRHGARAKKKHHPGCFFFAPAPAKGKGRRSPVAPARGQSKKKKKTPPRVFFFAGPGERQGKEKQKKKHHPGCFFFALAPCRQGKEKLRWAAFPRGRSKKKNTTQGGVFFFALAPCRRPTGLLLPLLSLGPEQKKQNLGGVFFLLWPRAGTGLLLPLPFPGAGAKKKTPWVVFFFLLRPRADAHSLTAGLGGDASPSPGWCFFFCCGPARTGVVFFFAVAPPGRSLTHCGLGRFRQGPGGVFFFFCCGPAGSF